MSSHPERVQHLEVLVGALAPALPGHVERLELLLEPADADAEVDPAAREPVERRDLLGHVDRVALGQEQHGRAQADGAGAGGQVGEGDQRLEQAAARGGGDAPVLGVGVVAGVLARRARRARPPRWCRCRAPRRPAATASSSSGVVMGLAVGSQRSSCTSVRLQVRCRTKAQISSAVWSAGMGSGSPARTDSAP